MNQRACEIVGCGVVSEPIFVLQAQEYLAATKHGVGTISTPLETGWTVWAGVGAITAPTLTEALTEAVLAVEDTDAH